MSKTNQLGQKLLLADETVSVKLILPEGKKIWQVFFSLLSHSCDSWLWLAGLFLLWLFGNPALKQTAVFWSLGLVVLAVLVLLIKFSIQRPRPEGQWGQIYRVTDPHSFPSGHAARAAAIVVMSSQVGSTGLVVALGVWAVLVGISRVSLKLHFFSDILVGWLIGLISGLFMVNFFPKLLAQFPAFFNFFIQ